MFTAIFLGWGDSLPNSLRDVLYRFLGGGLPNTLRDVLHMISVDWAYHNFRRCFEHCFIPAVGRSSGLINYEQF